MRSRTKVAIETITVIAAIATIVGVVYTLAKGEREPVEPPRTRPGVTKKKTEVVPPKISYFTPDKPVVTPGESVTLRWKVTDAEQVFLNDNLITSDSKLVTVDQDTTYRLKAIGRRGDVTSTQLRISIDRTAERVERFLQETRSFEKDGSNLAVLSAEVDRIKELGQSAVPVLKRHAKTGDDVFTRVCAAVACLNIDDGATDMLPVLQEAITPGMDAASPIAILASTGFVLLGKASIPTLAKSSEADDTQVRVYAVNTIGIVIKDMNPRPAAAVSKLRQATYDPDSLVRGMAKAALRRLNVE